MMYSICSQIHTTKKKKEKKKTKMLMMMMKRRRRIQRQKLRIRIVKRGKKKNLGVEASVPCGNR